MWVWCGIVLGVEWCETWSVAVMWHMCFDMWWCEMVAGGRLQFNVVSDVEYGGPR